MTSVGDVVSMTFDAIYMLFVQLPAKIFIGIDV